MGLTATGWANKGGTGGRSCGCGSWKQHWLNCTGKSWPDACSISGCNSTPTLGGHIYNSEVMGERIAPICDSCNKLSGTFTLKGSISIPSANKAKTCE